MATDKACYEDLVVGNVVTSDEHLMTREAVIAFAQQFDPQPFHLDDEAAAASPFGRLAASGWHTGSVTMRLLVDAMLDRMDGMGGGGIDQLRWHRPVYPGDRLTGRFTLLDKRRSRSRPEMGILVHRVETLNQHGDVVMSYEAVGMVRVRHPEQGLDEA